MYYYVEERRRKNNLLVIQQKLCDVGFLNKAIHKSNTLNKTIDLFHNSIFAMLGMGIYLYCEVSSTPTDGVHINFYYTYINGTVLLKLGFIKLLSD